MRHATSYFYAYGKDVRLVHPAYYMPGTAVHDNNRKFGEDPLATAGGICRSDPKYNDHFHINIVSKLSLNLGTELYHGWVKRATIGDRGSF